MKRMVMLAAALLLLASSACQAIPAANTATATPEDAVEITFFAATEAPTITPLATPTPVPTPTPTPTPEPTPDGLCGGRYPDKFADVPTLGELSYKSPTLGIEIHSETLQNQYDTDILNYTIADVYVQDLNELKTMAANDNFNRKYSQPIEQIAGDANALLAISGDYYSNESEGVVIRNGILYRKSLFKNEDLCVLYRDGTMKMLKYGTFTANDVIDADPWQVWGFGPRLLDDNGLPFSEINHRLNYANPRCAIGYYEPGHYCFIVVDGRQEGYSDGITLVALSQLMYDLGCTAAYNLDGGASARIYWNGAILNSPSSDNRTVADIIYFTQAS